MQTLTEQNVRELLVDGSMNKAVFVYFYMDSPECSAATSAVKGAIGEDNAYITLICADVKDPVAQALCMQIGFQGVPALAVFSKGRPVDALQGDDVTAKLQELISKYMPKESELKMRKALEAETSGDLIGALRLASEAFAEDPANLQNKLILARMYIKDKNLTKAHELLDNPGREEQSMQDYKDLVSALTLAEQAADSPELRELEKQHAQQPDNNEITLSYAAALSEAGKRKEAMDLLFGILQKDLSNEAVKKTYLDILSTMSGDPLQKQYRNKLYTLMY